MPGFPDLADFPDFPTFAEDAEFASLASQEGMMRQNDTAEFLNSLTLIPVEDVSGQNVEVLGRLGGSSGALAAWSLTYLGRGRFSFALGRVYTDEATADTTLEITGATDGVATVEMRADRLLYLHLTYQPDGTPKLAVKCEEVPDGWPSVYVLSESPEPPKVTEARFEFWRGGNGRLPVGEDGIEIAGFHVKRYPRTPDLVLGQAAHSPTDDFQFLPAPILRSR